MMNETKNYSTATAFRRALEDRLAMFAKKEGVDLQRMRRQVAFDRLLVRLFANNNPPWLLKGGYALELKLALARTTKDIDLGLEYLPDAGNLSNVILAALQGAAAQKSGDFFEFVIGEPMMDLDGAPYGGARYPVEAILDGRIFAKFHLDVGTGDVQREPHEMVQPRDWLGFAGIPATAFPSISREEHFAQKLHAYTVPRGDRPNSRVKDLVDLVLLIDSAVLDPERLLRDIRDTFNRRNTHEIPEALEPPPPFWKPMFERMAIECNMDPDMEIQFRKIQTFLAALNLR